MSKLHDLAELGQSIWLDYIRRSFLSSGELQRWIDLGVHGVTSNPSIFHKAITGSEDYTGDLDRLIAEGKSTQEIFEELVVADIRQAAGLLRLTYDQTGGGDGYVSLEVNPALAKDTQATLDEARRLWSLVDRPNLMVKIPATSEGIPAIAQTTAEGININITLIFSLVRYGEVMAAYLQGLEQRIQQGLPVDQISSVASFFVSRVDSKVDQQLEAIIRQEGPGAGRQLAGKSRCGQCPHGLPAVQGCL
jgi:transaldolase